MSGEAAAPPRKRPRIAPPNKPAYPRRRAAQACSTCRRRRTKCDNEQPACTSCAKLGIECFYQEGDRSTFDAASVAILQRLDTLEDLLRTTATPGSQQSQTHHPQGVIEGEEEEESSPLTTLKNLGSPSLEKADVAAHYYINIETVLSWPVFQDQYVTERLELKYLLQRDNSKSNPTPISIPPDLETNEGGRLLQSFLDNVHIYNPVLEVVKVKQYLRNAQLNGLGWDAQSCLLLLVFSLGYLSDSSETVPLESSSIGRRSAPWDFHTSHTCRIGQSEEAKKADACFSAAQKRIGALFCNSGVIEAQCFFLAGVYLMVILRPIEAWKMFVQALACCQGFNTRGSTDEERQLQDSIYWTSFRSELELRLELNISNHSVWDLTYPSFFPSPPQDLKSQGEAAWYFYLAEIALRRFSNRILNYVFQYEPSQMSIIDITNSVYNFEQQATDWLSSLPPVLEFSSPLDEEEEEALGGEHDALRFILMGHLLDCYEMIYWPFTVDAIHGKLSENAVAQSFAKKGFLVCVQRIVKNERGFYGRHHGTWLMLRSCTRSALTLIGAARSGLDSMLPPMWEVAVRKVMQMLKYWKDEAKDVADRLNILESLI